MGINCMSLAVWLGAAITCDQAFFFSGSAKVWQRESRRSGSLPRSFFWGERCVTAQKTAARETSGREKGRKKDALLPRGEMWGGREGIVAG